MCTVVYVCINCSSAEDQQQGSASGFSFWVGAKKGLRGGRGCSGRNKCTHVIAFMHVVGMKWAHEQLASCVQLCCTYVLYIRAQPLPASMEHVRLRVILASMFWEVPLRLHFMCTNVYPLSCTHTHAHTPSHSHKCCHPGMLITQVSSLIPGQFAAKNKDWHAHHATHTHTHTH